jgi:kynurenine formamidase
MYRRALGCLAALLLAGLTMAQTKNTPAKQSPKQSSKAPVSREWLSGIPSGMTRVVDLTYPVSDKEVPWPGDDHPFVATVKATPAKEGYFTRSFNMLEHYGTHVDAPIHFPPGKTPVDKIPVEKLFGPAVVIDVRNEVAKDPDYRLTLDRIAQWESDHGKIPEGAIVILRTGWSSRWPDVQKYRNMDAKGVMHFPGYSTDAAVRFMLRKVSALGIDTLSIDYGPSQEFPAHKLVLGDGLYQIENLADLSALPESGAFLVVAPIKLEGGSGGPARVFAILP